VQVIHLSDTHLGYREFQKIDPKTGINQREQDVYDAFERVADRILQLEPDLVLHAGDLFDSVRPTNRAVNMATAQFSRLSRANIPTVLIAGNHDTPKIATTGTITQSLDALPSIEAVTSDSGSNQRGYRKIPVDRALVHAVSDAPTEEELAGWISSLEPDDNYQWNILVLHAGVRSLAQEIFSGEFNEHHVDKDLLDRGQFDYIALGHYHKRMEIKLSSTTIAYYSGATERFSFNESEYSPGFLRLEFSEEGITCTEELVQTRDFIRLEPIDCKSLTAREIQARIENALPERDERAKSLLSLKLTRINPGTYSVLAEEYLDDLRDRMLETNLQIYTPDEVEMNKVSLHFSDLRTEFADFINNRASVDQDIDVEDLISTGQNFLGEAMGEEDKT